MSQLPGNGTLCFDWLFSSFGHITLLTFPSFSLALALTPSTMVSLTLCTSASNLSTRAGSPPRAPPSPVSQGWVPIETSGLTKEDLTFSRKELAFFTKLLTSADLDNDNATVYISSDMDDLSDIEVIVIPPPVLHSDTVEGIEHPDPFVAAHLRLLHGAPISQLSKQKRGSCHEGKGKYYVVY